MILLDTHVALWLLMESKNLSPAAASAIARSRAKNERLACSLMSLYELAYVGRKGRLELRVPIDRFVNSVQNALDMLPVTVEIILKAANLDDAFHGDPIDRMIVATAILHNCTLTTADQKIHRAGLCKVLW